MPATRKRAVDSESTERSSTLCTMTEGELLHHGWGWAPLLPLRRSPLSVLSPRQAPERAAIPRSGPGRATGPESNPRGAPISPSSPERAPVSPSSTERDSVPESSQERDPVPELGPKRAGAQIHSDLIRPLSLSLRKAPSVLLMIN